MFDAYFLINYGGKGHSVAMTSKDMDLEQAQNLSPVEGCIVLIVPAGLNLDINELEKLVAPKIRFTPID